jgi:sugar lactone lactonase YvrE
VKFDVIADGLGFPEGPIAMADGSVLFVEVARGALMRAWGDGRTEVVARTGGVQTEQQSGQMERSISATMAVQKLLATLMETLFSARYRKLIQAAPSNELSCRLDVWRGCTSTAVSTGLVPLTT